MGGLTTYLPPTKCRPVNHFTKGFGAVKLIKVDGWKPLPGPELGGPFSMFQELGASTEVTGSEVSARAFITAGNGSLTSPEKLKPVRLPSVAGYLLYMSNSMHTKDSIHNVIRVCHGGLKIVCKGNLEVL